jgi:tetratricopeptide (TPR) repeat protein
MPGMIRSAHALLASLLLACACVHSGVGGPAGERPGASGPAATWRQLRSAHIVLSTDLDSARARETILQLEFVRGALVSILGAELPARPLEVVAFAQPADYQPFQPAPDAFAHYSFDGDGEERVVMWAYLDQARRVILSHEMAHYVSYHAVPRQPPWFAEGLAQYLASGSEFQPSFVYTAGVAPHAGHLELWHRNPVTIREVLGWDGKAAKPAALYVRSWVLVHYLANRRPDGFRALRTRLAGGAAPPLTWDQAFPGWSLDLSGADARLDQALSTYQLSPASAELNVQVKVDPRVSERTLTAAEARDVRLGLNRRGDHAALEPEVEAALAADPGDVRALMSRGERTPGEAAALAHRAVEAHPESPLAWAFLGRSGFPPGDHAGRAEALRRAVALDPEHPARAMELSRELLALGRSAEALGLAERAGRAAPFSPNAPYLAAWALAGLGRCTEASASVERAASLARAVEERDFPPEAELARMQRTCAEQARGR